MYVITNRAISNKKTLSAFGKKPNPEGANELRLMKVTKTNSRWQVNAVADKLNPNTVKSLNAKFNLGLDVKATWHGSLKIACELFELARKNQKSILFFIHGLAPIVRLWEDRLGDIPFRHIRPVIVAFVVESGPVGPPRSAGVVGCQ